MFYTLDGVENVRELGGLVRDDGACIRHDVLFRTGHLGHATPEDICRLEEFGISAVIDLRDPGERKNHPDKVIPGAKQYHVPVMSDLNLIFNRRIGDDGLTAEDAHEGFMHLYWCFVQRSECHEAYKSFLRILLESEGKPVLWHCTQGKDRTGIAALLLLVALGFDEELAVEEYMLTNRYMEPQLAAAAASGKPAEEQAILREILLVFHENIQFYIQCIQLEYGSVMNYLEMVLELGPKEIETLERYYLK